MSLVLLMLWAWWAEDWIHLLWGLWMDPMHLCHFFLLALRSGHALLSLRTGHAPLYQQDPELTEPGPVIVSIGKSVSAHIPVLWENSLWTLSSGPLGDTPHQCQPPPFIHRTHSRKSCWPSQDEDTLKINLLSTRRGHRILKNEKKKRKEKKKG